MLVTVVTGIATLLGILFIGGGVGFIMAAKINTTPELAVVGSLTVVLGAFDIIAGIKFYYPTRLSWVLGVVASTLTALASLLQVHVDGGVWFSITLPTEFGILAIIFPLMIIYSHTKPSVRSYFRSIVRP